MAIHFGGTHWRQLVVDGCANKAQDAHVIQAAEYEEIPESADKMFVRAVFKKAGRPKSANSKQRTPASTSRKLTTMKSKTDWARLKSDADLMAEPQD